MSEYDELMGPYGQDFSSIIKDDWPRNGLANVTAEPTGESDCLISEERIVYVANSPAPAVQDLAISHASAGEDHPDRGDPKPKRKRLEKSRLNGFA